MAFTRRDGVQPIQKRSSVSEFLIERAKAIKAKMVAQGREDLVFEAFAVVPTAYAATVDVSVPGRARGGVSSATIAAFQAGEEKALREAYREAGLPDAEVHLVIRTCPYDAGPGERWGEIPDVVRKAQAAKAAADAAKKGET